jgi:hypothetical protein
MIDSLLFGVVAHRLYFGDIMKKMTTTIKDTLKLIARSRTE